MTLAPHYVVLRLLLCQQLLPPLCDLPLHAELDLPQFLFLAPEGLFLEPVRGRGEGGGGEDARVTVVGVRGGAVDGGAGFGEFLGSAGGGGGGGRDERRKAEEWFGQLMRIRGREYER
jgi:hypothetical protein